MTTFAYTALARDGKRTTGTLSADNRAAALTQVLQRGLSPIKIDEEGKGGKAANGKAVNGKPAHGKSADGQGGSGASGGMVLPYASKASKGDAAPQPPRGGRVSQKAVENFTRELANLLSGGVPLARALSLLKREAHGSVRYVWGKIHDDVVSGNPLAESMAKWPKAFSTVYVAMVRAGEAGGFLDVVLGQIADFRTREQDLKGKVKSAMIYPVVLALLATAVLIFLLTFFIPRFSGMFHELGGELPALTKMIVAFSNAMTQNAVYMVVALVIAIFLARRFLSTTAGKRRMENWVLSAPVLGRVIAHFALVRFARMLGTLVGSGVPLVASLKVAREAIGNQTLADTVSHAIDEVQRGSPLSRSLAESPKLFPPSVIETIAIAEETGRLDKELVRLATAYEGDLERQLRMLVAVVEPIMLFVMAGIIGTVVVGMLLPVFKLQDLMSK